MKLFIDGDGSPVKEDAVEISQRYMIEVVIVTSIAHYSEKKYPDNVTVVYVDKGTDAADYKIVQLIQKNDILVTQDYGLASLVLPKGIRVIHQLGYEYTAKTIDSLLEQRYFSSQIRKSGGRTKGPKPFTEENRTIFKEKLIAMITQV